MFTKMQDTVLFCRRSLVTRNGTTNITIISTNEK